MFALKVQAAVSDSKLVRIVFIEVNMEAKEMHCSSPAPLYILGQADCPSLCMDRHISTYFILVKLGWF